MRNRLMLRAFLRREGVKLSDEHFDEVLEHVTVEQGRSHGGFLTNLFAFLVAHKEEILAFITALIAK